MEDLIIKEQEIKEEIVKIINNSNLPAFILKAILKEFYDQLNALAGEQLIQAKQNKAKKEKDNKEE